MRHIRHYIFLSCIAGLSVLLGCRTDEELREIKEEVYPGRVIGVSENVVVIDDEDENVESEDYDIETGEYSVTFQDSIPPIATGSVIVIDRDTSGYLRMVNSVTVDGNTVQMGTGQATLEDVFYDSEFKLSTEMVEAQIPSGGRIVSAKEIESALTDEAGFIHPLEMHIHRENGTSQRINAIEDSEEDIGKGLYKYYDFSQTDIIDENGVRLYVDEGYFEFDPVIKLEFEFDRQIDGVLDVIKGKIKKFSFYSDDSKLEFKSILKGEASLSYDKTSEWKLKNNLIRVKFKFLVAGVPVWITIDSDLLAKNQFNISGEAAVSIGIKSTRLVTCGAFYENSNWQPIYSYTKSDTIYPLEVGAGNLSIYDRFEIFPSTKILFYGVIGPSFDIVPYLSGELNSSIELNRDLSLTAGVDARLGVDVSVPVLSHDLLSLQGNNISLFDTLLWYSPKAITIVDGNNQTGETNSTLPVPTKVKVTDSEGWATPFVPVYFETVSGNGSVDHSKVFTDINGFAETNWTLGDIEGEQTLSALIQDGGNNEIGESRIEFKAFSEVTGGSSKIAIVNPDNYRIVNFGYLSNSTYYSIANGIAEDGRNCDGGWTNPSCWNELGIQNDFIGDILENNGYIVDYFNTTNFPNISFNDYGIVIVQDPSEETLQQFDQNDVENEIPDLLEHVVDSDFLNKLQNYFETGGKLLFVGDAVRLMENGSNRLNLSKSIIVETMSNSVDVSDNKIPAKWPFIRGNPFCCRDRTGSFEYTAESGNLVPISSTVSSVSMYNGTDLPISTVWSDIFYYPSDAVSLLDVRIQGNGEYVLDGSICNPTIYNIFVDNVISNYIGYTLYDNQKVYFISSDSFFNFSSKDFNGEWHCSEDYIELKNTITEFGEQALLNTISLVLED